MAKGQEHQGTAADPGLNEHRDQEEDENPTAGEVAAQQSANPHEPESLQMNESVGLSGAVPPDENATA